MEHTRKVAVGFESGFNDLKLRSPAGECDAGWAVKAGDLD